MGSQASSPSGRPPTSLRCSGWPRRWASRGPDGAGSWSHDAVALAHRRLKIIDLSCAGDQPMTDPELGLTIVFNGCIYNHRELRAELERDGARFFSTSDTEVILKAYDRWGRDCVTHFKGMFAFAVYEHESRRLLLARDRLGVKPLYLADVDGALRFASTLPALLAGGGVDTELDPVALHHYLELARGRAAAAHDPPGASSKLTPATTLLVSRRRRARRAALLAGRTSAARNATPSYTERDWDEAVLEATRAAVKRRMVADVPVGVLLSGGLDSSLIVALLADSGQQRLATFSIGFDDVGEREGNEFRYSDVIAERVRHRPPPDPHRDRPDAARARRRDHGDERADGLPRRGRVLPALAGGRRSPTRSSSPARAPTRCSPATPGTRRCATPRAAAPTSIRRRSSTGPTTRWRRR